jgi:hypothetical protein
VLPMTMVAAAAAVAGCGTPAYCSDLDELEKSVNDLKGIQIDRGALPTLRVELGEVGNDADAVVRSAREDFPSQTSAVESSLSQLSAGVQGLPESPSREELRAITPQLRDFLRSAQDLSNATRSACA